MKGKGETMARAINAAIMKERNYRRFLFELRAKPTTRAQLARQMGLTRSAISLIADDMLSLGFIKEGPPSANPANENGIKALLEWNKDRFYVGGINLGRDTVSVGIMDFCGGVFDAISFPSDKYGTGEKALERAAQYMREMIDTIRPPGDFLGIGVASPGPLGIEQGKILDPPYFDLFWNLEVVKPLKQLFDCEVYLENDANSLALAEKSYGLMDRYDRFMELLVDMGIGAALYLDDGIEKGPRGFGNGLGHTSIDIDGIVCPCGSRGCVEMYASIPRIIEAAQQLDPSLSSWRTIVDCAYAGDENAVEIMRREALYLSAAIANASNLLDLQAVIFAGEYVLYRPAMLIGLVDEEVNKRITSRNERRVDILPSQIPSRSRVISSANVAIEKFLERPFVFHNAG